MNHDPAFAIAFYAFAALAVVGAAWVALLRNIVRSAFSLLATFVGVAGLYALLSADLVAVVQVMVYVGGVLVLMLFAVMLTARIDSVELSNRSFRVVPALLLVLPAVGVLVMAVLGTPIGQAVPAAGSPTTAAIGAALLGPFVLPFEVVSLLLLAALLGAVALSRGWGALSRTPVVAAGSPLPTAPPGRTSLRVLNVSVGSASAGDAPPARASDSGPEEKDAAPEGGDPS
jgi:NADH:ubiquinone oxidoreductase subunit 6 (subunit J)